MFDVNVNIYDNVSRRSTGRASTSSSRSTMPSSAAANFMKKINRDKLNEISNFNPNSAQNFVRINHVGEFTMIYNIFTTPESIIENKGQAPSESPLKKSNSEEKNGLLKKKYWIAGISLTVCIVLFISLEVYASMRPIATETSTKVTTIEGFTEITTLTITESTTYITTESSSDVSSSTSESTPTSSEATSSTISGSVKIFKPNEWGPELPSRELVLPIDKIIVAHTADDQFTCSDFDQCKFRVRKIQQDIITFNFLIGGDGSIYEGRGFEFEGGCLENVNEIYHIENDFCIGFIGTFQQASPTEHQLNAFNNFIRKFTEDEMIVKNYKIIFLDQITTPKISADSLLEKVKNFNNFYPGNLHIFVRSKPDH